MQLRHELSFGNLLSIAVVIGTAAIAWGAISAKVASAEGRIEDARIKMDDTKKDISNIENTVGRMDERVKNIERSTERQEQMLRELVQKVR